MKKIVCWRQEFFLVGIIVFLMLMMSSCSSNESNYSFNGDDTHRTEQTGITTAITAIIDGIINTTTPAGSIDTTFGTGGKVTTAIGTREDQAYSVAIQSDGKIVVAGSSYSGSSYDFALARYNEDGSLDTSFGIGGIVTTDIGDLYDFAYGVAIQSDGKIVAAGVSGNHFALARYNVDGTLDPTFDTDGIVKTAMDYDDCARSVAIQSDGKIVAAGYSRIHQFATYDFAVARYNADGTLDPTFDTDGKVKTIIGFNDFAYSVAIQSDGKIVVAGYSNFVEYGPYAFSLVRYNADGTLDPTFDTDGIVTTAIGLHAFAESVAIQSDGKIVAAGYSTANDSSPYVFALTRYNADGTLDTTFDTDGIVTTAIGTLEDQAKSVALQSDGKIVAAGLSWNGSNMDFALARYNANGTLDTTFGTSGKVTTAIGTGDDYAYGVAIQDGKIIVAGYTSSSKGYDFALARYWQ